MAWGIWKKLKDGAKKMAGKVSNFFKNGGVTKVLDVANIRNDKLAADSKNPRGLTKSGGLQSLQNIIDRARGADEIIRNADKSKNIIDKSKNSSSRPVVSYNGRSFIPRFKEND